MDDHVEESAQLKNKILLNEEGIMSFMMIVDGIYNGLNRPLPRDDDPNNGVKNYTDKNGKTHFSKMLRNCIACQRLFSLLDRVKEVIFTHEYLLKEFELQNNKVGRNYLEIYLSRNLVFLDIQVMNGLMNFLSYFFDLSTIDGKNNVHEFRNFLYIRDKKVCMEVEKILKSNELQQLKKIFQETRHDYAGLPKITNRVSGDIKNSIKIDALKPYPAKEVLLNSGEIINKVFFFLKFMDGHLKANYQDGLGYNSGDDFVADIGLPTGYFRGSKLKEIEDAKQNAPIKILNLTTASPQQMDNKYFTLYRNHTFEEMKDKFYRSSDQEVTTVKFGGSFPVNVEKKVYKSQEGALFWTHTLVFKENGLNKKSKLLANSNFAEDISLLLSLFSGVGVYTEQSALRYSHKAKLTSKIAPFEFTDALSKGITTLDILDETNSAILGKALSKYREVMQPTSHNNRLVKLCEILDILGDFYCKNPKKEIPNGYDEKSLQETIEKELKEVEKRTGIPLIGGFTPILTEKSIGQKIKELAETFKIHDLLEIKLEELKKLIYKSYKFRGKLTHSSGVNFLEDKDKKDLVKYFFFVSQLVFVVLLKLLEISPEQTLSEIKSDMMGLVRDEDYYQKKYAKYQTKQEEFIQYLSGEKPLPPEGIKLSL